MANIITVVLAIICFGVTILVIRIYKENQLLNKKITEHFTDEDDFPLRP